MRLASALAVLWTALLPLIQCSRLTPPVLPLIVRNPYLSTWLPNARGMPWEKWPMFWTGQEVGLSVMARVPSEARVYPLLGRPQDSLPRDDDSFNLSIPIYRGAQYDASTTNLSYSLPLSSSRKVDVTLSFLSPITPTSTLRQSIPASYITVYVSGNVPVEIYLDLNGLWVSGDRGSKINWMYFDNPYSMDSQPSKPGFPGFGEWVVKREIQQLFTEFMDRSEWGSLHFLGPLDALHQGGTSAVVRQHFARAGSLNGSVDDRFRSIMDDEPVFAFSKSFNLNTSTYSVVEDSATFTVAHIQDPVVQFASARGLTLMRPLWESYFQTNRQLLTFHYLDFPNAKALAANYSAQLAVDAYKSGAEDYVDIVALSARQVLGATSFSGTPDDPILFLKEISSNGNFQTIDVIFPAFPFFLYTNPQWLGYLLEPLIEHMLSGQYPNKYAMHDLGTHFPNATGHPDGADEYMPVEECGNILIMGLALANALKDGANTSVSSTWKATDGSSTVKTDSESIAPLTVGQQNGISYIDEPWVGQAKNVKRAKKWVSRSYRLWKQWTSYLVEYSLEPHNQLSTDDFAGWLALQTNLALKGIIGIKAMAGLAELTGNHEDAKSYNNISEVYIAKWEEFGISRDKTHAKLAYHWYGSWTTTYNLYADSQLCFHLGQKASASPDASISGRYKLQKPLKHIDGDKAGFVPKHIYQMQSDWYYAVRQKYGLPLDSRHLYTKTDWEFFAMAVAAPKVRAEILQSVAKWANETSTGRPLTDLHDTEGSGGFPGPNFFARPVVGGHFAFLALGQACNGQAMAGLEFLDDSVAKEMDVQGILDAERAESISHDGEL
ncbi:glutaminase [Exophiala dermatitidis]